MKNQLNTKLIKTLLFFDFFFLKKKYFKNNRYYNKIIKLSIKNNVQRRYLVINSLELIKNIKQVIRLFQFFLKNKKNEINFNSENQNELNFFAFLKKQEEFNFKNIVSQRQYSYNTFKSIKLNILFNVLKTDKFYNKMFMNKTFLFLEFNAFLTKNDFGIYKIFSDFIDWKKLLFLFLLISFLNKKK
jgi:hypothetical protein